MLGFRVVVHLKEGESTQEEISNTKVRYINPILHVQSYKKYHVIMCKKFK